MKVPEKNFLDWFQYSSTIQGVTTTCYNLGNCPLSDYPYNMDLLIPCSKYQNALTNPWSINICVAAALSWYDGMESFLAALTCRYNIEKSANHSIPASSSLPALSVDIAPSSPYTQQNYIDFVYGSLSSLDASVRWPTAISWVTRQWDGIVKWTNYCGESVPKSNLSDFLLYSQFRIVQYCYRVCGTETNPGCASLFGFCTGRSTYYNPWLERTCVLAATCYNGGLAAFAADYSCEEETSGSDAQPVNFPRLEQSVWNTLDNASTGLMGLQDYINVVTTALNGTGSVPTTEYLTGKWAIISNWTAFPSGSVPFRNFADWLQYS
ncbi:hypothetical protein F5887DRAFT_297667 [Amanita rubescens]|nr:hypothetical protein F5887DRAFT_297667 [Amanita rubescens]